MNQAKKGPDLQNPRADKWVGWKEE